MAMLRRYRRGLLVGLAILLAAFLLLELLISKYGLCVTRYEIPVPKLEHRLRIVQLTDLHNSEFGAENARLLRQVADQAPDLILVTGDLVDSGSENPEIAVTLLSGLREIAPVYVALGNHELEYRQRYDTDLTASYEAAGAVVLDRSYLDLTVNGSSLRLGGIYGYCLPARYLVNGEADGEECAFLAEFQNTDACTILLCHMPACWIVNDGIDEWDVDCVFAGHAHGGQIRIPLIGGLWAPDQGWFPGREAGLYFSEEQDKVLVLSRGLGSTERVPRFHNVPEILVADLVPEN